MIQPKDIEMADVPTEESECALEESQRFLVVCPGCKGKSHVRGGYLGMAVKCKSCGHHFTSNWGEPLGPA